METMQANLTNIAVVLHKPRYPENVGAAARCALNMGIPRIIVVSPSNPDREKMLKMATHEAASLIQDMEIHDDISTALAPFQYVVGTTARSGRHRKSLKNPRELAGRIVDISQNNRVALLFGPENTGLSNEELRYCHVTATIPTAVFSSLNLSHAVMIMLYEIFTASGQASSETSPTPHLATSSELQGMYGDLREALRIVAFLKVQDNEHGLDRLRDFLSRVDLLSSEARLIRGLCRQLKWFKENALAQKGSNEACD